MYMDIWIYMADISVKNIGGNSLGGHKVGLFGKSFAQVMKDFTEFIKRIRYISSIKVLILLRFTCAAILG